MGIKIIFVYLPVLLDTFQNQRVALPYTCLFLVGMVVVVVVVSEIPAVDLVQSIRYHILCRSPNQSFPTFNKFHLWDGRKDD